MFYVCVLFSVYQPGASGGRGQQPPSRHFHIASFAPFNQQSTLDTHLSPHRHLFLCFFFQHIWGPFLKWQPPSCQDSYVSLQRIFPIHYKDGQRPGWRGKKGRKEVKVCVLRPVISHQWFTWRNHLTPGARLQIPFTRFICTILENSSGKRERGRTEAVIGKTLSVRQNWALAGDENWRWGKQKIAGNFYQCSAVVSSKGERDM